MTALRLAEETALLPLFLLQIKNEDKLGMGETA